MVGRGGNKTVRLSDGMLLGAVKKGGSLTFLVKLNTCSFNELVWKNLNVNDKGSSVRYVC